MSPLKLRDAAVEAAHASGRVLARYFGGKIRVAEKTGAGLVTNADVEAEETAVRALKRRFPGFAFLTEEAGQIPPQSPSKSGPSASGRWIIDPLDGTTNFVHRFPMFCVSIGAEWEGRIVAAAIYHPILRETYAAARGHGATLNGKRMRVSRTKRLNDSLLTTGFAYRGNGVVQLEREIGAFERLSRVARAVRRPGSAALDLAYTACGVFDGFWERALAPWDVAAGTLLVEEAGGKVTDFQGNPFRVGGPDIVVSNGHLHPALLQCIASERHEPVWPGPV